LRHKVYATLRHKVKLRPQLNMVVMSRFSNGVVIPI